jgi:hypothetical protein
VLLVEWYGADGLWFARGAGLATILWGKMAGKGGQAHTCQGGQDRVGGIGQMDVAGLQQSSHICKVHKRQSC